ncbi:MAG: methylglyoxal synthase [Synechococcales bacterium]|nr:methylglyoxal synthase [Synechococcales bacterium]
MSDAIALIAHNTQKDILITLVKDYLPVLSRYRLLATQSTGQQLQSATGLSIEQVAPGEVGGDIQLAAAVVAGDVVAVIFLVDPTDVGLREPDSQTLLRSCQLHDVPIGLNWATSRLILDGLARTKAAHLIFNPVSGAGEAKRDLAIIREQLNPYFHLTVHTTTPEIGAEELAQQAVEAGADLVIASGGDGTVSAIAGPLIGTGIPLGVIPRGTANAFSLALGIPLALTPIRNACRVILEGHTRVVDAARCNGKPMILLAGIGLEAETVDKASRELKNQWGALAYLMAGWQMLNEHSLFDVEVEVEDRVYAAQAGAITIANAAPPTSVLAQGFGQVDDDDGLLDLTVATAESKLQAVTSMLSMFGAALVKTSPNHPNVRHGRVEHIKITANPPQKVVVDGEVIGTTPVEVECIPQGLSVFVPRP